MSRILDALASRRLSAYVLGLWAALTLVWVVPFHFAGLTEEAVTTIAAGWLAFRITYGLVLLTTTACVLVRARRDIRRARGWSEREPRRRADAPIAGGLDLERAQASLAASGMSVHRADWGVRAVRHPWGPIGGSLFHLAVLVIAVGLALHASTAQSASLALVEGERIPVADPGGELGGFVEAAQGLTLRSITPEFHEDVLLFSRLDAVMVAADGSERAFSLASPLWLDPVTYLTIEDFGYAPGFTVTDAAGTIVARRQGPMGVFPPGTEDVTTFEETFLDVSVVLFPDHGVVDGRDVSLSYNLADPKVLLSLSDASRKFELKERRLVGVGEPVEARSLVGTVSVTVDSIARYGSFRLTRSWGMPVLLLGGLLAVGGIAMRLFMLRMDVAVWQHEDGGVAFEAWMDMSGRAGARDAAREILEAPVVEGGRR